MKNNKNETYSSKSDEKSTGEYMQVNSYQSSNPVTSSIEHKSTYYERFSTADEENGHKIIISSTSSSQKEKVKSINKMVSFWRKG